MRRVPGSIVALVLGTVAVVLFQVPVETIGSKFGAIPGGLPPMHIPTLRVDLILPLLPAAMTVALLAAVESLLSAVVADSNGRSAQLERRTHGARGGQHPGAASRRHSRHRSDCAHRDELPLGRALAGGGHGACRDAAGFSPC